MLTPRRAWVRRGKRSRHDDCRDEQFRARGVVPQRKGPAEAGPGRRITRGARHATSPTRSRSRANCGPTAGQHTRALCRAPPTHRGCHQAGRGAYAMRAFWIPVKAMNSIMRGRTTKVSTVQFGIQRGCIKQKGPRPFSRPMPLYGPWFWLCIGPR